MELLAKSTQAHTSTDYWIFYVLLFHFNKSKPYSLSLSILIKNNAVSICTMCGFLQLCLRSSAVLNGLKLIKSCRKFRWWNVVSMIHSGPTNKEEWNAIGLKGASHIKTANALQTLSD